jgi:hypothetical protein
MNKSATIQLLLIAGACLALNENACAATIPTQGAGSAVSVVDRQATFDTLNASNTQELGNYTEGGLYITTGNQSWGADPPLAAKLDPFHGATAPDRAFFCVAWENTEWTSIRTTNRALIHGVEFVYGNGWTTGDIYGQYPWGNANAMLEWQTWRNGTMVSSGTVPFLAMGTIVGFYDPSGFDELLMRATIANSANTNDNALALDNLNVMLTNTPPAPVIYGSDFSLNPASGIPSLTVWDTIPGCQYRLVYSENLASATWYPVTPPLPDGWQAGGGMLVFTDPGAVGKPHRFYRVEAR